VAHVRVTGVSADAVTAVVLERSSTAGAARPRVLLAFGVSKGGKNDDIVEGGTEVGVTAFLPVLTQRSIVKLDADKRLDRAQRWQRVALAASKQSKRSSIPEVRDPADFAQALTSLAACELILVAWEDASAASQGIRAAIAAAGPLAPDATVALVVGPEGGFTAEEVRALAAIGAVEVTLGDTILRAETAAVVAAALVVHELGGLGDSR
jgi:16S rRNA (uracil1498-N3)-methyltransferase